MQKKTRVKQVIAKDKQVIAKDKQVIKGGKGLHLQMPLYAGFKTRKIRKLRHPIIPKSRPEGGLNLNT